MKKLLLLTVVVCALALPAKADRWYETLALYIPNRVLDAMDCFTVNVGAGPVLEVNMMCTHWFSGGGSIGKSYKFFWDHNRQYGFGVDTGYYWTVAFIGDEDMTREGATELIKDFRHAVSGVQLPSERNYDWVDGPRDFWQIGLALGGLIHGQVYLHPVEVADAICGVFLIDFKGDDLTFDDMLRRGDDQTGE